MAGLLDGEGTIGISRGNKSKYRSPYISVTSTTKEIVDWLHDTFGGIVSAHKVYQEHHKQSWIWQLRNKDQVFRVMEMVKPYMLEPNKKARITLVLNEYNSVTPRNGKYTDDMTTRKVAFEERFLALK